MPIDFRKIASGEDFELLCEALLRAMGFTIMEKVARGPDQGKDIIASKLVTDDLGFTRAHRFLIECKHHAKGGGSVLERELGSPIGRMSKHDCDRYILATSTLASEKVQGQLDGLSNAVPHYQATVWHAGDLARLLDQHPDVRERYFPFEPGPRTPAGELAGTVEGLLKVMGFICHSRKHTTDCVQLTCISKGALARPVAVVCKEGTVQKGDVETLLVQVRQDDLSGGVLVTHTRVSPSAHDRAAGTGGLVRAFTLDTFYRELIDFEPYVRALVADYDENDLSTYYVDLGCKTSDGSEIKPMDGYLDAWLDDSTRNHISILGDYGTGKTSFCQQYAATLGRRWLSNPDRNRIPILISLLDYAKTLSLEPLVTDFLVNQYGIQAGYEAFRRFNADGKLVLLFDGFDEMAQKVDYQTTVDNFEELARAVEERSKVILTCRTPYFRSREEAEDWLSSRTHLPESSDRGGRREPSGRLPKSRPGGAEGKAAIDLTNRPNFEIVHLLPFDDDDIRAILRTRFRDQWERYQEQVQKTYNLAELAQRPVLLDMIARTLPTLQPGQAVNAARLYEVYTDVWLKRDWEKGRTLITREAKRLFMQELALEMHRRSELSIHYSRLPEQVRDYFHLEKAREIDYFDYDVRACSFLNRDPEGNYRFLHRSFGEFFVAQWLAARLQDGTAPEMRINEEIRGFVHGLLEDVPWPPPLPEGVEVPEGLVWVPEGPFIYGEGTDTLVVSLDHDFFVSRTPVTNAEYARFVAATEHRSPSHWQGKAPSNQLRDAPVVNVSWHDAVAYCRWLTEQLRDSGLGEPETSDMRPVTLTARLPTEEEWEKAARGIDGRLYPWGDEFDPTRCNSRESRINAIIPVGQYSSAPHPEQRRKPVEGADSPCGRVDVADNVWEWTASEWEPGDPSRVLRGGSLDYTGEYARCAYRYWNFPYDVWHGYGFRVCLAARQD